MQPRAAVHNGSQASAGSNGARARAPYFAGYTVALLLLLGCTALAVATYRLVERELTQAATTRNAALARLAAVTVSERLERMVDLSVSLATRVRFADLVARGEWEAAGAIMRGVPAEFPFLERLFLADVGGTLRVDEPPLPGVRGRSFAFRDWFQGVSREWRTYVSPVYERSAEPRIRVVAVATPVRAPGGEVAGVLVLQLALDPFFDWVHTLDLGEEAELAVVDSAGKAVYGVPRDAATGAEWLVSADPARHGWRVVIQQPAHAAFAARDRQLRLVQIAYVLAAFLIATLGWIGVREARRRREQLGRARAALARHDERLRILGEIDRAMVAEQPAEAIAAAVIRPLRELLGVPRAIVNRIDLAAGAVEWIAAAGRKRTHAGPGVRYATHFMGDVTALARGEPQVVDVRALPESPESRALLVSDVRYYKVVPMIAGGELLGAISFGGATPEFPAEQVAIAQEVATQLAIATTQARLLERVRRHADELEERVRARTAELETANRELDDLYDNAPCGYHSVGANGLFVRMNQTELNWLGYTRDEVIGKMGPADLHTPASLEIFKQRFKVFSETGVAKDVEYEFRRRDGTVLPVVLHATAIRDRDGRFLMSRSTIFDNTDRKRAAEQLAALNANLQRHAAEVQAANQELGAFSYSVSHDLRAPLRAVDGYARMLEEDYADRLDDEGRRLLGVVRGEAGRMGRLIDDLLAFSRSGRQAMRPTPVDMGALAREVLHELRPDYPAAQVALAELPPATGDRALLRQVWANLIGNALKYSARSAAPRVDIGACANGADVEYWVQDNGAGFDPRYADKLFGVFQRLHDAEEFPGTGVGLAIVQRVVARHGGRVAAHGRPGEGARFSFSLPAMEARA